jgi:hypothetical protein
VALLLQSPQLLAPSHSRLLVVTTSFHIPLVRMRAAAFFPSPPCFPGAPRFVANRLLSDQDVSRGGGRRTQLFTALNEPGRRRVLLLLVLVLLLLLLLLLLVLPPVLWW